jgi:hypothetical protein
MSSRTAVRVAVHNYSCIVADAVLGLDVLCLGK